MGVDDSCTDVERPLVAKQSPTATAQVAPLAPFNQLLTIPESW
jgi:hypothetical protein